MLKFDIDGAECLAGAAAPVLAELEAALSGVAPARGGARLHGIPALTELLVRGCRRGGRCCRSIIARPNCRGALR